MILLKGLYKDLHGREKPREQDYRIHGAMMIELCCGVEQCFRKPKVGLGFKGHVMACTGMTHFSPMRAGCGS